MRHVRQFHESIAPIKPGSLVIKCVYNQQRRSNMIVCQNHLTNDICQEHLTKSTAGIALVRSVDGQASQKDGSYRMVRRLSFSDVFG